MSTAPRHSAALALVREGETGLELAMVERTIRAEFAGGALVFPGGALDADDRDPAWDDHVDGLDDATASRRLGTEAGGLAWWIAAARECFEEAGVLLADAPLDCRDRDALNRGERGFRDLLAARGRRLALGDVHYWAHWVTPEGMPRRYDTRFFVAAAPDGQRGLADGGETTRLRWLEPRAALAAGERGEVTLLPATRVQLEQLARHATARALLDHFATGPVVARIEPVLERDADGRPIAARIPDPGGGERMLPIPGR